MPVLLCLVFELSSIASVNTNLNTSGRGAMQRSPKGMGRGQQRESSAEMTQDTTATLRGLRSNSKMKVLVRSHAMREETSPPRDPSCTNFASAGNYVNSNTCSTSSGPNGYHQQQREREGSFASPTNTATGQCLNPTLCLSPTNALRCSPPYQDMPTPAASSPSHELSKLFISEGGARPDLVTVRTQDINKKYVNSSPHNAGYSSGDAPSKAKCDDKPPKDKCAVTKTYNSDSIIKETNINSSSPCQTSDHQKVHNKQADSQRNVDNTHSKGDHPQFVCSNCLGPNCTKCPKASERNINNNISSNVNNNVVAGPVASSPNMLSVGRSGKHKLRQQSASLGSFEGSTSTSPSLSRDGSMEQYTDTTGVDLVQFILETLNRNAKDRVLMLKIEQELVTLAKDKVKTHFKFSPMSSYQRMLVHRCAAFFGMDHNIETSGKCVVVNKTKNTRIPDLRFRDHIREDILFPEEPRRSILKRDSNSFEDCNYKSPDHHLGLENRRSKSFEEREEEYEKVRRRIFKDGTVQECGSQEDFVWSEAPWPGAEIETAKIKLLPPEYGSKQSKLLKVQSVDSKSETLRPCVAKSHSFGGYGGAVSVLTRGDSVTSTHSAGPRLLTKQDSSTSTISWRLSPSSSGYKSQSQRSDSVTPSPTTTPLQLSDTSGKSSLEGMEPLNSSLEHSEVSNGRALDLKAQNGNQLLWAVTDLQSVPKGSVLINPQSGQPFTNDDGSIYHFDPSNPPPGYSINSKPPPSPKMSSPHKSPTKDRAQSPKKPKSKVSPLKNKSCLINSSTSPILPGTPNMHQQQNPAPYVQSAHVDNAANMPLPSYQMYSNNYMPPNDGVIPMYQSPINVMYGSYGLGPQYDNRTDGPMPEMPGYYMNVSVPDSSCGSQPVNYQAPGTYWNQQSVPYYQAPINQPQRFPVAIPVPGQSQGTYMATTYPPNYVPIQQNAAPMPPNPDLVPVYTNSPLPVVYTAQQSNPNPVYLQNHGHMMYTQNPVYPHGSVYPANIPYPPNTTTPNSAPLNNAYPAANYAPNSTSSHAYYQPSQGVPPSAPQNMPQYDMKLMRPSSKNKNSHKMSQAQQNSHSSGGSSSPSSTIIAGYFPNPNGPINYRQCTPPETPPTQNVGYNYSPNCQPIMFKPMGGVRASPPVNVRNSRSPTPASDYSQCNSADKSQRIYVAPNVYHGMSCVVSDVRHMPGRGQPQVYRQSQRPQNFNQSLDNTATGRSPKVRKNRTKVPALPPSGRQSNQSISTHAQRF